MLDIAEQDICDPTSMLYTESSENQSHRSSGSPWVIGIEDHFDVSRPRQVTAFHPMQVGRRLQGACEVSFP